MNALAGGGTFATLPALIGVGLPSIAANATSNVALLPGAATSAWAFRDELRPLGGVPVAVLCVMSFTGALIGSVLLVLTPTGTFEIIIPWLLLFASLILAFGKRAAAWLHDRVTIGPRTLIAAQGVLGIYGGYFGGGVGLMTTAVFGLLAGITPRQMFAPRTLLLAIANAAAAIVFSFTALVRWPVCLPMLAGTIIGGWAGAGFGKRLPAGVIRAWTLFVAIGTTIVFVARAYG